MLIITFLFPFVKNVFILYTFFPCSISNLPKCHNGILITNRVLFYFQPQYQLKLFSFILNFFQNNSRIRFIGFYNVIRIGDNFWYVRIKPFLIIRMPFFNMLYSFIGYNNLISQYIIHNTLIYVFINLSY